MKITACRGVWGVALLSTTGLLTITQEPLREATDHPEAVLIVSWGSHPARACLSCGVLVSSTAVLTVAHGVAGFDTWEVTAPYARGETKKAAGKVLRVHPSYRPNGPEHYPEYDLAVLILDRPIDVGGDLPKLPGNEMHPINTPLLVVGRGGQGQAFGQKMFGEYVTLVAVPNNINLYGGHPSVCRPGDSGGPVYLAQNKHQLVALVAQHRGFSRANVPTDIFVPLSGRTKDWIVRQLPADSGKSTSLSLSALIANATR